MKIAICVCFSSKNKSHHQNFLNSLNKIIIPTRYSLSIYIIINNNLENSKDLILKIVTNPKVKIKILKTSKKNIPSTRNVFLKSIKNKEVKFIGFLDDDCNIDRNWLFSMTKFITRYNCDIVGGPQLHETTSHKYRLFYDFIEPKYKNKQKIDWIATNNCFFKKKVIDKKNCKFDERLKNIGGSDQLFFKKLKMSGNSIMWNIKATVSEYNQKDRENINWFLKRNFRYGFSGLFIDQSVFGKIIGYFINVLKIIYLLILGIFEFIKIFKNYNFFKSSFYLCRAAGRIFAMTKFKMKKYH
jgi:hypothetical protein|tara:strand:+ start:24514 stop:25410 length:897 start_codon:yes stop_codon:yes gene_type:complete